MLFWVPGCLCSSMLSTIQEMWEFLHLSTAPQDTSFKAGFIHLASGQSTYTPPKKNIIHPP